MAPLPVDENISKTVPCSMKIMLPPSVSVRVITPSSCRAHGLPPENVTQFARAQSPDGIRTTPYVEQALNASFRPVKMTVVLSAFAP